MKNPSTPAPRKFQAPLATIEERETELFGETVAETVFRRSVE